MRGVLPIYVLITVTTGIIILLSATAVYYTGFSPFSSSVSVESAKSSACSQEVRSGCKTMTSAIRTEGFDADRDGTPGETATNGDNLFMMCKNYYGVACTNKFNGDMNNDCIVEGNDFNIFNAAYGSKIGDPNWNPDADLDKDGDVDSIDFGAFAGIYGSPEPAADTACKKICQCY